jgi:hypothetical protein
VVDLGDSRTFTRTLAGVSLIVGPLLLFVGTLIGPEFEDDSREWLEKISDNEGTFIAGAILFLLGSYVLIPGVLGIIRLVRRPRIGIAQIAAGALLLGVAATIGFYVFGIAEYIAATGDGLDRDAMVEFHEEFDETGWAVPLFVVFLVGVVLGNLVLGIVLWRRGVIAPPFALALALGGIVAFVGENKLIGAIAFGLLTIGYGAIGLKLLSLSDEEWGRWEPLPESRPEEPG